MPSTRYRIDDRPPTKSSFDKLLKLHEVVQYTKVITASADIRTEIPGGEEQAGVCYGVVE